MVFPTLKAISTTSMEARRLDDRLVAEVMSEVRALSVSTSSQGDVPKLHSDGRSESTFCATCLQHCLLDPKRPAARNELPLSTVLQVALDIVGKEHGGDESIRGSSSSSKNESGNDEFLKQ